MGLRRRAQTGGRRRSSASHLLGAAFDGLNSVVPWHRLPTPLALLNLMFFRDRMREENLHDTSVPARPVGEPPPFDPRFLYARTSDGSFNDLQHPEMGRVGTRFGRNVPLRHTYPEPEPALLLPNPRTISRKLLTRESFIPATTLNLLAAVWIQFQVHDWFSHGRVMEGGPDDFQISLEPTDEWPRRPMRIARTPADPTRVPGDTSPPTYLNAVSHWWDASAIYGSDESTTAKLRAHEDGKLAVQDGGLRLDSDTGVAATGFSDNWWVGLLLMHTVFTLEHNAICEHLRREYPAWSDDRLFDTARLVNCALIAKIHTIEWTPAICAHPTLRIGMRANWWGLVTERITRTFGRLSSSEAISGIPGSPVNHHATPFALTEEFVSVYRMHPLIPDDIRLLSHSTGHCLKELTFADTLGRKAQSVLDQTVSMADALYSFGIAHPGAVTLHNYPRSLQNLETPDGRHIDLATVDILRDRERGVPRYNQFRRLLGMAPIASYEELTPNPAWARELREVYGDDPERLDLMVGMFAETPPAGFGFSDTAFRIFILMASRRLKSDRFFTTDYTPRVYTQLGLDWIDANDMSSILLRHFPELGPALRNVDNAFAPWDRIDKQAIR
ncbi:MAG: peroxidase [Candidatus Rokuibacteriota bacterium]|nr:MAG: peroxidase [Candidatus Rokubacteria bacterium]